MLVTNERYILKLYKRIPNSAYEYEDVPCAEFKGRPANQYEKRKFRIQQGVQGNNDSVYVVCSNLPKEIKPEDKIEFLGKTWTVTSIGYYFDQNKIVNPAIFDENYISNKCPKGIALD